jgi:hypothetical protein
MNPEKAYSKQSDQSASYISPRQHPFAVDTHKSLKLGQRGWMCQRGGIAAHLPLLVRATGDGTVTCQGYPWWYPL